MRTPEFEKQRRFEQWQALQTSNYNNTAPPTTTDNNASSDENSTAEGQTAFDSSTLYWKQFGKRSSSCETAIGPGEQVPAWARRDSQTTAGQFSVSYAERLKRLNISDEAVDSEPGSPVRSFIHRPRPRARSRPSNSE